MAGAVAATFDGAGGGRGGRVGRFGAGAGSGSSSGRGRQRGGAWHPGGSGVRGARRREGAARGACVV